MKKRIAILTHGGIGGGVAAQGVPAIMKLVEWMATVYDVHVYSYAAESSRAKNYYLHSPSSNIKPGIWRWFALMRMIIKHNRQDRFHIVYALWGYPAGIIAYILSKYTGAKSLLHLQGGDATAVVKLRYGVFANPIRGAVCRFVYNRCDALVCLTEFQRRSTIRNGVKRSAFVIPFGVPQRQFSFKPKKISQPFQFLMVGNLTPIKNWPMALRVFRLVCDQIDAELTVVGPDYDNNSLVALACELKLVDKVKFVGHQPYEVIEKFYHHADVLLHTALYEGQGLVFSEAAACGTLIAATRVGLASDMSDECAILVNENEEALLAKKILMVLRGEVSIDKYRDIAHHWIRKYDEVHTQQSLKTIIDQL